MWYAGVDWADDHHDAVLLDESGHRVGTIRVEHSAAGLDRLKAFLLKHSADQPEQVACMVETNHGLLITALLEAGFAVYPVNPKTVDRKRKPSGAKTDKIDAYLLARTGRNDLDELRRLTPDNPIVQELKGLTRDQDGLIQSQTRLVNQLTACLKAYYPVALTLFSKLNQQVTLEYLKAYPTPDLAHSATVEQLRALLIRGGHPHAASKAREMHVKLHEPQLRADPVTVRTKSRLMLALVSQLEPLMGQIEAYDEEIQRLFHLHPDSEIFDSLPGAGERLAPRLLSGWGDDRERYRDASSIQALGGTSAVTYESGNYSKAHQRYACIKPLRNALYEFAWCSTRWEGWAKEYYRHKREQGKSHSMAVRALANQWVRIVHAMWHGHALYNRNVFITAQRIHGQRAA